MRPLLRWVVWWQRASGCPMQQENWDGLAILCCCARAVCDTHRTSVLCWCCNSMPANRMFPVRYDDVTGI
jgi:hypothetical protein